MEYVNEKTMQGHSDLKGKAQKQKTSARGLACMQNPGDRGHVWNERIEVFAGKLNPSRQAFLLPSTFLE